MDRQTRNGRRPTFNTPARKKLSREAATQYSLGFQSQDDLYG